MRILSKIFVFLIYLGFAGTMGSCSAKDGAPMPNEIDGWYDHMTLPSPAEKAELQKLALSDGVDLDSTLKDLPENNLKAWTGIFKVSMHFRNFDRRAAIYGYQLFTAFSYFIDSVGEAKFAELINAQPPQIRQRVRDFLYFEAYHSNPDVMRNNERQLRVKLKLIFPMSYTFATEDKLFAPFHLK